MEERRISNPLHQGTPRFLLGNAWWKEQERPTIHTAAVPEVIWDF